MALQADLVRQCTTMELADLGLSAPPRPVVPKGLEKLPIGQRLAAIQKVHAGPLKGGGGE